MKVVWSPLAEQRAMGAVDYIAEDRPAAAKWLEGLLNHVAQLDQLAERGRMVPEIGRPAYRELLFAPYRVIYRVDASRVVILTLRHTRRAWD
jgi:plasmid stabilization system protein ParE